ncbi:MAG: carbamoyl phosphate synthase large subunit, partial [Actinobacteria bacterium]|nr:carbamoyl phosphate synthase large subunit [Actinomycetota bacterium]
GKVFISVNQPDKEKVVPIAKRLLALGFTISATRGTAKVLESEGISCQSVQKIAEGRPNVRDHIINDEIAMVFLTASGADYHEEEIELRQAALSYHIPIVTTITAAEMTVSAIERYLSDSVSVKPIQAY